MATKPNAAERQRRRQALADMRAFEDEQSRLLQERAALVLAGQTDVLQYLQGARQHILTTLAGLPADWQQWHLSRLLGQIEDVLAGASVQAGARHTRLLHAAWEAGEAFVDKPLERISHHVALRLPQLDVATLKNMQAFGALRLKDVGQEATRKIGRQLALVTIGAQTPFEAIRAVQKLLGSETPARAAAVVHTGAMQVFAAASHERLVQAAAVVPGLCKQWRRSGKIHSRWHHDLIDGQVQEVGQPYKVPNPGGGIDDMQHPHAAGAPPEQVIHCGCISRGWSKNWQMLVPGAKPFSERELRLNARKAALDQRAKRAGQRKE